MLTRRCTQRQFLLRPDRVTNATFLYCLADAARRHGIVVLVAVAMSNHHHTVVYDREGKIIEFTEHFHKMFAKAQNAHRGRWENLWASEPPSLVRLVGSTAVIDKVVYAATNPVKDGLVEHAHQWPGVNGLSDLLNGRELVIRRPTHFFRSSGGMPETVQLKYVIPPELGDADEILRIIRARVEEVETTYADERRRSGARVMGVRNVRQQSWCDSPASVAPRGGLRPRVASRSVWARVEALARNRKFVDAYRAARACWVAGLEAIFPAGTYWLRRFAGVAVANQ
jgi:hypothetical protein